MSLQVEMLEKSMAKLTIEVPAEELDKAINAAYHKQKNRIQIPGFRKGKAPRAMIEKLYGVGVFYEDAANEIIPDAYENALKETDIVIVSQPSITVDQIEKGKPFIFSAEVAVKPEVTLGDYKGIEVEKIDIAVSDEEIQAEMDKERERNAREITVDDRALQENDTAIIDFEGFMDGEAFEGGAGTNHALVIGSHSFIDNFEEQLIGMNIGEEKTVNVTFPEQYQAEELAGKPAEFKVKLNEIKVKELPELDDDFAQDVSEFDTLAEYKDDIKKNITEKKEKEAAAKKEDAVINKIIENASMEIADPMVDAQVNQMMNDFAARLQQQGLGIQQYFQFTGMNQSKLADQMKPQALSRIQARLVLEKVAEVENLAASDEDYNKELERMSETYKMEIDKLKEIIDEASEKQIREDIAVSNAAKFVTENAVEK